MKKQFIRAIFCAPTGEYEDKPYPSRLNDKVFSALAEAGINRIFAFTYDNRPETIEKTFELCEKYHMKCYPTPRCAEDYVRTVADKDGHKPFLDYTEEEKAELDQRLICEINDMKRHESFGGIFFQDEAGYMAFEGIARAKRVFDVHFSEYEFHNNFFSYAINDAIFWGGMSQKVPEILPFKLEGDLEITFQNRFNYYNKLVEGLLSKASFEFLSQDMYPFENFWPTVPTAVHVSLYELNAYFNKKKQKYGSKFYNYMQVGHWFGGGRPMTFAEMALQMNVTAAYGSDGFAYFPGCFPLEWVGKPRFAFGEQGGCSLIDLDGNKTVYCDWIKELNGFFLKIEHDILSSNHLGVQAYGQYQNGFTKGDLSGVADSETIYQGDFPDILHYESGLQVESENQVMLSSFDNEEKRRYYIVNLSTIYDNKISVELPKGSYRMISLQEEQNIKGKICITLNAGCGVYIMEE